jgi:SAM-dependent methyltransferase
MSGRRRKPAARDKRGQAGAGGRTDWQPVANWYDELVGDEGSEYHREVVLPGVLRLLAGGDAGMRGRRILDVACGQGVLCRRLVEAGAEPVGVDLAPDLVQAARQRSPDLPFFIGDARTLGDVRDLAGPFDAAAIVLAIANIQPIRPVLEGVAGLLRDGGSVVIVTNHPAFRGPGATAWGWDAEAETQYRRVDRYLLPRKEPITTHPGDEPSGYTWSFHRPIGLYVKACRQAGLLVDAMEEWPSHKRSGPGPRQAAEDRARQEIPMFLALRAVKITR